MEILPPDWEAHCQSFGGSLDEIPRPLIRYYPHPLGRRRPIYISIIRYWGVGQHYYANFSIPNNPVWDGRQDVYNPNGHWFMAWNDPDGDVRAPWISGHESFLVIKNAIRDALKAFPETEWEYHWGGSARDEENYDDPTHTPRWFYGEGD